MEFYKRHVCRVDPFPDYVQRTFAGLAEHPDVYMHMQGPNEFVITGTLKDWDITARLGEIRRPDPDHRRRPRRVHAAPGAARARGHRRLGARHLRGQPRTCSSSRSPSATARSSPRFLDRVEHG